MYFLSDLVKHTNSLIKSQSIDSNIVDNTVFKTIIPYCLITLKVELEEVFEIVTK